MSDGCGGDPLTPLMALDIATGGRMFGVWARPPYVEEGRPLPPLPATPPPKTPTAPPAALAAGVPRFDKGNYMTQLKLTMMLGPRETIEVGEAALPEMPHVLFASDAIEGWDADQVERVLMAAGPVFRKSIAARKHEEPPPPPRRLPPEVEAAIDATPPPPAFVSNPMGAAFVGDPPPAERLFAAPELKVVGARVEVARVLAPSAWAEVEASLRKADEILAVIERRRAA